MSSLPFLLVSTQGPASARRHLLIRAWLPAFLLCAVIAVESTAAFGSDHTSRPLRTLLETIFGATADSNWVLIHHYLRKTGHFTGFGMLSLACFRGFSLTLAGWTVRSKAAFLGYVRGHLPAHVLAVLASLAAASADEFHQHFLPNRTGKVEDVLLDTAAALILQMLLYLALSKSAGVRLFSLSRAENTAAVSVAA